MKKYLVMSNRFISTFLIAVLFAILIILLAHSASAISTIEFSLSGEMGFLYGPNFANFDDFVKNAIMDKIKKSKGKAFSSANIDDIKLVAKATPKDPEIGSGEIIDKDLEYFHMKLSHLSWPPSDPDYDFQSCYNNNLLPFSVTNGGRFIWAELKMNENASPGNHYYVFVPVFHAQKHLEHLYMSLRFDKAFKKQTIPLGTASQAPSIEDYIRKYPVAVSGLPFDEIHFFMSDIISLPVYKSKVHHVFLLVTNLLSKVQENEHFELDFVDGYTMGFLVYKIDLDS